MPNLFTGGKPMRAHQITATKFARMFAVLFVISCFTGCTTLQAIQVTRTSDVAQNVHPGDVVRITTRRQETLNLTVSKVDRAAIYGSTAAGNRSVEFNQIGRLEVRRSDPLKTSGLIFGSLLATWLTIGLIAFAASP